MATRKLLLADDSITIQRVIELTFSHEDMQVIAVSDGEEAIARIAEERPDVVLADIAMPKCSGYDVAAFVKGRPDLAHIPVVLLAGAFEPVDDERARQAGSNGVLVKPFEPQHVIARVRELLGGAKGNPTTPAAGDIPRPAVRLAGPRPVELPPRDRHEAIDINDQDYHFADRAPGQPQVKHAVASPTVHEPPAIDDSLDDYFDRLDAAFDDLEGSGHGAAKPASRSEGPVLERDLDYIDAPAPKAPPPLDEAAFDTIDPDQARMTVEVAEIPTLEELLGEVGPRDDLGEAFSFQSSAPIDVPLTPAPAAPPAPQAIAPPPIEPADITPTRAAAPGPAVTPVEPPVAPDSAPTSAPPAAAGPAQPRSIADVFSALLAAEEQPGGAAPRAFAPALAEPVITDTLIERIADRVLERLRRQTGQELEQIVARITSEVAERLVRDEINRIRSRP